MQPSGRDCGTRRGGGGNHIIGSLGFHPEQSPALPAKRPRPARHSHRNRARSLAPDPRVISTESRCATGTETVTLGFLPRGVVLETCQGHLRSAYHGVADHA